MKNEFNPVLRCEVNDFSIPSKFFHVKYNGKCLPTKKKGGSLHRGANCQKYAYEVLHALASVPVDFNYRSSELWEDNGHSLWTVDKKDKIQELDLLLFNCTKMAYGAHVGLCVGNNKVLHLCKEVGYPTIWSIEDFLKKDRYKYYIGAKRLSVC